jgi:CRISPR-associated protein (TIGR02584 family)
LRTLKKNILICVSGLTPQIVTETFYCLTIQNKIRIDEIYIITTQRGREVIYGTDNFPNTPKTSLKKEIKNLCRNYKIKSPRFENNTDHIIVAKEESLELSDIRTDKDNILFPNKVVDFIRQLSLNPNTTLFCSISGGRKTMSVHLAFALSLFGRENDKLLHVLTSEENEFKGFYPVNKIQDKALQLSEIPFVRLRSLLIENITKDNFFQRKYDEIVSFTQKQLKVLSDPGKFILRVETKEFQFNDNRLSVEPLIFTIYFKFLEMKLENKNALTNSFIQDEFHHCVRDFMIEKYNRFYDDKTPGWWNKGFHKITYPIFEKITKINKAISNLIVDPVLAEQFKISSERSYGRTSYSIKADKTKFKIIDQ